MRLTGGRACWRERGHSYRSICSYRKLPPPACPGTTCKDHDIVVLGDDRNIQLLVDELSKKLRLKVKLEEDKIRDSWEK